MSSEIESVEANVSSDEEGSGEDVDKSAKLSPKKEEKSPKENNKKSPVKQPKEEEEAESGGNESNESAPEENNEEPKLGLLDQPVEISGSRERKKVQRLEYSITTPSKEKLDIPEGSGEKLGDCPRIEFQIQKVKTDELKILHRILFNRPGSGNEVKKNIRRFSGFTFAKDSAEYEKKKNNLDKITNPVLKHICEILDLERSGTKEDVSVRLLDFLLCPKASGKKVPATKKRSSKGGEKPKQKTVKSEKKVSKKKQASSDEDEEASEPEENEEEDEVDEKELEDEDEEEIEVEDDNDDDSEMDEKKRKRSKPSKPAKDRKKRESKSKKSEEKKTVKSSKKSKKATEDSSEESSDDEPLAKKAKGPPTDEEIKQLVKKILDGANLEEITMKKVIKQVFDDYPEFDLGDKKDFIKSTVRSLIS